jgi:argininosuccinate synthase
MTGEHDARGRLNPHPATRVVLAYDGGPASTAAIAWIVESLGADVVCLTLDVGQKRDLLQIRDRALAAGAMRGHVVDARDALARDYILPVLQADAVDHEGRPMVEAVARPLVAQKLVEIASLEQATAVAHGAVEPAVLDRSIRALAPGLDIIVPAREWSLSAADIVVYARARGIGVAADEDEAHGNLWGRITRAPAETRRADPGGAPGPSASQPDEARGGPADIELAFDRGVPVSVNEVAMPLIDLIASLETIGGAHGVGRLASDAPDGSIRPAIVDAPAAVLLHLAHRELARTVLPPELVRLAEPLGAAYARLLSDGLWHSPTRAAIDAFVASAGQHVTGSVRLRLLNGRCAIVSSAGGPTRQVPDFAADSLGPSVRSPSMPAPVEP